MIYILLILFTCIFPAHSMAWLNDFDHIREKLLNGSIVTIENAFEEDMLKLFDVDTCNWEKQSLKNKFNRVFSQRSLDRSCSNTFQSHLTEYIQEFENLIYPSNINFVSLSATNFEKGDFLDMHNDFAGSSNDIKYKPILTFILHMNNMEPECGGDLIWAGEHGIKRIHPKRNTLHMFIPSPDSFHSVEMTYCKNRISISGWFIQ